MGVLLFANFQCVVRQGFGGVGPFLSNKYDITKHKRYKELADFNKNNAFDVEKYLAHRLVMSEDTEFEMYEIQYNDRGGKQ